RDDFPELAERSLDESFRSTAGIVAVANRIGEQIGDARQLRTGNPAGPAPQVHLAVDAHAEAVFVAREILRLLEDGLVSSSAEVAVLYRTNAQAGELIQVLRQAAIPYRAAGDAEPFCHSE